MSNPNRIPPFIPSLVDGERLTRDEFESRYDATPNLKRAYLLEGIVRVGGPVRAIGHGDCCCVLIGWIGSYFVATPGTQAAAHAHIRLDSRNMLQPDVSFIIRPSQGGQARISADDYLEGGPELVAEVWARDVRFDFQAKRRIYQRHGVREFVVWRVERKQIYWFILRNGQYDRLTPTSAGLLCSETFPGLWLDTAALFADDYAGVMATLQRGIADPTHADFVAELQSRVGKRP
jgi:Uma2 family endonuclease